MKAGNEEMTLLPGLAEEEREEMDEEAFGAKEMSISVMKEEENTRNINEEKLKQRNINKIEEEK